MPDEIKITKRSKGQTSETKVLSISRSRSNSFQSVYADNTEVSLNFFGISLLIGEVASITDGVLNVFDHALVHMSPEHAASLHALLGTQLDKYRAAFGALRELPEGPEEAS